MDKEMIGLFLLIGSGLLLLIGLFRKSDNFIDLRTVLKRHFQLFADSKIQFALFYILPIVISTGMALIYVAPDTFYNNLLVAVSIFVSMLLAMMSVISSKNYDGYAEDTKRRIKNVIDETNNAIVFCTFISIVTIFLSLVAPAVIKMNQHQVVNIIISAIAYYMLIVLLLNILLIVKRLGKLV